jgi:hypothetical protein
MVYGLCFKVRARVRVQGSRLKVEGSRLRVKGQGLRLRLRIEVKA